MEVEIDSVRSKLLAAASANADGASPLSSALTTRISNIAEIMTLSSGVLSVEDLRVVPASERSGVVGGGETGAAPDRAADVKAQSAAGDGTASASNPAAAKGIADSTGEAVVNEIDTVDEWTIHYDETNQAKYRFNARTGESQWLDNAGVPIADESEEEGSSEEDSDEGEDSEEESEDEGEKTPKQN